MSSPSAVIKIRNEDRMIRNLLIVSALVHLVVMVFDMSFFWRTTLPHVEEWQMEADLLVGEPGEGVDQSALPNAVKADEAAVPEKLLPMLSKHVSLPDAAQDDPNALAADEKIKQPTKEEQDAAEKKALLASKQSETKDNQITQDDALRRLAIEKLRSEQKFSDRIQSEQTSAIARLKQELAQKDSKKAAQGGGMSLAAESTYRGKVRQHVKRCYTLPSAYGYESAKLKTVLGVFLNGQGKLLKQKIVESSGDKVFDEFAVKALDNCSPLPPPPKELVDVEIALSFSSQQM